ncbi:sensor histidine kinase [Paraburkholderia kirstenboschensis]|uniref:histidine kinase n=1 Tax=Paraburkholderia kirstenboschensis TaxID=1245436 RepID=A0ABZ0E8M5_9BURK|nr:ATP-binding protein [Paraburkholderia kirstenboschensis]WOD13587.1 ATP-binding protein [Paraburkholderia kirstenboschensis]
MVGKLSRLPAEAQTALRQLACLGNIADFTAISIVLGTSEEQVHAALWPTVRQELIERLAGACNFVHDRIQEAAYSLIPEKLRGEAHLRIGRLLAAHVPAEKREEAVFDLVNQLNCGAALITSRQEREQLAELNLIAGKRAKASTAYVSALTCLNAGAALLAEDYCERRHELAFSLEINRPECEFLTGELAAAEERLAALSRRAAKTVERATVACLRVDLHTALDQSSRAIAVALDHLRHLGIDWAPHPTNAEARREYERVWAQLGSRTIESLIDLPLMSDPVSLATLDVLTRIQSPAVYTDANLLAIDRTKQRSVPELKLTGTLQPYEKEFFRKDGSRVSVLIGAAMFEEGASQGVAFVLDLTERKRAEVEAHESERRYHEVQMELAHSNRAATMGQLTASIAHEVQQPIAATATAASAALRWLDASPPNLAEVRCALGHIVNEAMRAGGIVGGIRDLIKKAPPRQDTVDINEALREVVELTGGRSGEERRLSADRIRGGFPLVLGDRVQLQQVMLNLIVNAVEAMTATSHGQRELLIHTAADSSNGVSCAVQDSGPGLPVEGNERVFDPFYTTKAGGLGMGWRSAARSSRRTGGDCGWARMNPTARSLNSQCQLTRSLSHDRIV